MRITGQYVPKQWGYEYIPINDECKCLKFLSCQDNVWSSEGLYHMHLEKDETFYVTTGILELDIGGRVFRLCPGEIKRIKPLTPHRFRAQFCQFVEVSTPDKPEDSIRGTLEDLCDRARVYRDSPHSDSTRIFWH